MRRIQREVNEHYIQKHEEDRERQRNVDEHYLKQSFMGTERRLMHLPYVLIVAGVVVLSILSRIPATRRFLKLLRGPMR